MLLVWLIFILWIAGGAWLLTRRGRRFVSRIIRRASNGDPAKSPHEKWPEILDWRKGDRFDGMYTYGHSEVHLVAIQPDGYAITDYFGDRDWIPISGLVGHNRSLKTRRVNADLKRSGEYMELLDQFHIAVKELEARDRKNGINIQ